MVGLLFAASAQAAIYRWVNPQGSVVFSDVPPPGGHARKLNLDNPLNTIHTNAPSSPSHDSSGGRQQAGDYSALSITSPGQNQQIRANNGDITISLNLEPALKPGDQIRLFMDGAQVYSGTSTQISLNNINRGTHTVYAVVETAHGTIAIRSSGVTFTLLRFSALFNPQATPPTPGGIHQAPRAPMMPRAHRFHYP